jgi:hypothetical protein
MAKAKRHVGARRIGGRRTRSVATRYQLWLAPPRRLADRTAKRVEPAHRRLLELGRLLLSVEADQLVSVLERNLWKIAGGSLSHPEVPALERSLELGVGMTMRRQERMFA